MSSYYFLCLDCRKYRYLDKPNSDRFHDEAAAFIVDHAKHNIQALTDADFVAQDCDERYEREEGLR